MRYGVVKAEYEDDGSISLYVRNEKGNKEIITVEGFLPYFYVPRKAEVPKNSKIIDVKEGFNSIFRQRLKKITMKTPSDVKKFRENFKDTFEADIPFTRRFMIDCRINSGIDVPKKTINFKEIKPINFSFEPKTLFIDIEVVNEEGKMPDPEKAEEPIISITIYSDGQYITLCLGDETKKRTKGDWITLFVTDERELLRLLKKIMIRLEPDIITAWNVDFDIGYIKARSEKLGVHFDFEGVHIFDLLSAYKKVFSQPSYKLKEIAKIEKISDEEVEDISGEIKEHTIDEIIKYNMTDVEYCVLLDKKHNLIEFYWNLKVFCGLNELNDTLYHSVMVDTLLIRLANENKMILPSKKQRQKDKYEGAIVFDTIKGIHENVAVYDISRYYPSIIIGWNLSPETKNYGESKIGILPRLCKSLLEERDNIERKLDEVPFKSEEWESLYKRLVTVKSITEAVYGYTGSPQNRIYDREIASKVTEIARNGLLTLRDASERRGYKAIAGDTDSIFIKVKSLEEGKEHQKFLNEVLGNFCKGRNIKLNIKFEKFFSKIMFIGVKKRYAGRVIYEKGKEVDYIHIKGFETIRTDQSPISKNLQSTLFNMIFYDKEDEILPYLRETIKKVKKIDYDEIAIVKGINKPFSQYKTKPDYVRGAIYANKHLNANIGVEKVKMLYIKSIKGHPNTDVICYTDKNILPEIVVDYEKMIDRTIKRKIEKIIELLGITWDDVLNKKKLSSIWRKK